jgi:hypothetical protein
VDNIFNNSWAYLIGKLSKLCLEECIHALNSEEGEEGILRSYNSMVTVKVRSKACGVF